MLKKRFRAGSLNLRDWLLKCDIISHGTHLIIYSRLKNCDIQLYSKENTTLVKSDERQVGIELTSFR